MKNKPDYEIKKIRKPKGRVQIVVKDIDGNYGKTKTMTFYNTNFDEVLRKVKAIK